MSKFQTHVTEASVARTRSRLVGTGILAVGGTAWCIVTMSYWPYSPAWSIPVAIAVGAALLVFCLVRLLATRGIRSVPSPAEAAFRKHAYRWFRVVFAAEIALCAASSIVLANEGHPLWIPIAIALIVGAHFLPLGRVFRVPLYYGTGAFCVLGVLASLPVSYFGTRLLCVGLAMTFVLWASSGLALWHTRHGVKPLSETAP